MTNANTLASARYWLATLQIDPSNARMVRRRLEEARAQPGDIGTTEEALRRFERVAELVALTDEAVGLADPETVPAFPVNPEGSTEGPDTDSIRMEREKRLDLRKDLERLGAVPAEFLARIAGHSQASSFGPQTAFAF